MLNKKISLLELTKLIESEDISEKYVKYICGLQKSSQYRHSEIVAVHNLISNLNISEEDSNGFIYDYVIPQLNKEFDLLKITDQACVNIELKSEQITAYKIKKQLLQNSHYLKMLGKAEHYYFTYVMETNKLYKLEGSELFESSFSELNMVLNGLVSTDIDMDSVFTPSNILVSPLNSPRRFLTNNYLLTENQENIKNRILTYISLDNVDKFIGLTGGPGTGKTLLIYDIAKELSKSKSVLIVHSGILCDGHLYLDQNLANVKIISAKALRLREIKDVDIVIVDESHRLYENLLEKAENWVRKSKTTCIFSYDITQKLSKTENRRTTTNTINSICDGHIYKLTNKIRTNKELALFITCLFDISKYREEYSFNNVKILFEPNRQKAVNLAKSLSDYNYISYTPSIYASSLDSQKSDNNTHTVIGQEFENVCMIIDDNFYYDGHLLKGLTHPNPDYIFEKLLFQGLTRVRSKLAIIITSENILLHVLTMFN